MPQAKDTLLRLVSLLKLIPRYPHRIASTTLQEKLREEGFHVDLRSIQRDLNKLAGPFMLLCDEREVPYRWSFDRNAPLDLSAMDTSTALALYLAESHLKTILPAAVLDQLAPQFRKARHYLDGLGHNDLAHWARRVRSVPNGKALIPAQIDPEIWARVSTALLERRQLKVSYLSRSKNELKTLRLHPAGIVSRHSITYLIASANDHTDIRHFAVHRIKQAKLLDETATDQPDFDIDQHLAGGLFRTSEPVKEVELVADVSPQIAWLLSETPLSAEQSLEPIESSSWARLRAIVSNNQELLWWFYSIGDQALIQRPTSWKIKIKDKLSRMNKTYKPHQQHN
ncbi:helix-turn-helix transcriptional regulator [Pseudomonas matsuisoli]|uniref:WYL domain-containing protein n=1 Tax=Pseudomonas matsuisoli TaxID=1515666 RepID=A0A917UZW1_9PSED|nr:WYL domain-containing protein [Pseudomonas matsuisoli]GGK02529.1 hypothetical protein GCM10009304_30420 [Pseudomonas matsuisoli]